MDKLVSLAAAARTAGVHPDTVRRAVKKGLIPAVVLPTGTLRLRGEDVSQILQPYIPTAKRGEPANER